MSSKIVVYSTSYCPYCVSAKNYLKENGFSFDDIDLTGKYDEIDALKNKTNHRTVPQIFVDDQFIGGYTDMIEKINSGDLVLKK